MQAPDAARLREALDAIQDDDPAACRSILDELLAHAPAGDRSFHEIEDPSSLEEKAWICVELSRQRLDEDRLVSARVMLHSAIDHAEDQVAEGTTVEDEGSLLG